MNKAPSLKVFAANNQTERWLAETYTWQDVKDMIKYNKMSIPVFDRFVAHLNWRHICRTMTMSEEVLIHFEPYLDWASVSRYQRPSETFIENHLDRVNWYDISAFQQLSRPFVERHHTRMIMTVFFNRPQLLWTEDDFDWLIETFGGRLRQIWHTQTQLSEDYINRYHHHANELAQARRTWSTAMIENVISPHFTHLVRYAHLTEAQLERFIIPRHWEDISANQVLSIDFIIRHQKDVVWHLIAAKQVLSYAIIHTLQQLQWADFERREFSELVQDQTKIGLFPNLCDWNWLSSRHDIKEEILQAHAAQVVWDNVVIPEPSDEFLLAHYTKLRPDVVTLFASEKFLDSHPQYVTRNVRDNERIVSMWFFDKYQDVFGVGHLLNRPELSLAFRQHLINEHPIS